MVTMTNEHLFRDCVNYFLQQLSSTMLTSVLTLTNWYRWFRMFFAVGRFIWSIQIKMLRQKLNGMNTPCTYLWVQKCWTVVLRLRILLPLTCLDTPQVLQMLTRYSSVVVSLVISAITLSHAVCICQVGQWMTIRLTLITRKSYAQSLQHVITLPLLSARYFFLPEWGPHELMCCP